MPDLKPLENDNLNKIVLMTQPDPTSPPDLMSYCMKLGDHERRINILENSFDSPSDSTDLNSYCSSSSLPSAYLPFKEDKSTKELESDRIEIDKEVDNVSDYVSKDAFEAHIRRLDDRVENMGSRVESKLSSMEERINKKIDRLADSIETLNSNQKTTQAQVRGVLKKVHVENTKVIDSNRQILITLVMGFLAVIISVASLIIITK